MRLAYLLIHTAGEKSSVDRQHVASDETRRIGGQKNGGADKLFQLSKSAHRSAQQEFLPSLGAIE